MKPRSVLLTGASGFVGQHMIHQLRARGYAVTALDLGERPDLPPEVEFRSLDLRDPGSLAELPRTWDG